MTTNPNPDRYRRRTEIEARQWTGSNTDAMSVFCSPFDFMEIEPEDHVEDPDQTAAVRTHPHGGWVGLKPGDWVVREAGRYTTASDEEFRADWEPAPAAVSVVPPATNQTAPVDRAAVLREAADALGRMDYDTDSHDYGYDTYRDAWNGGVMDGADLLRGLAVEAEQAGGPSRVAAEPQPAQPDRCPHGCDTSTCPCLACEAAETPQPETPGAIDPSWPRRAWDLGLLHKGGDPHHCPACVAQPEPPKDFICPGAEANAEVLANPQPVPSRPGTAHTPTLFGAAELEEKLHLNITPLTGDQLTADEPASRPGTEQEASAICVCGHCRSRHVAVNGRLLCDECEYDAPNVCAEFTPEPQ